MAEAERPAEDPYSRLDYRRLVAWPSRLERERPLLTRLLDAAPERSVLDVGCGSGEHARHLACEVGARVVGVDRSERQIALARDYEGEAGEGNPRFLLLDVREAPRVLADERFGAAVCLGNVLPHFEDDELDEAFGAVADLLAPRGLFLLQWLNPGRLRAQNVRCLAVNLRDDPKNPRGEVVFLRLLRRDDEDDRHLLFFPTTLALDPDSEEPVAVVQSRRVRLRMWQADEVERRLRARGFEVLEVRGGVRDEPFEEERSQDVVLLARRRGC